VDRRWSWKTKKKVIYIVWARQLEKKMIVRGECEETERGTHWIRKKKQGNAVKRTKKGKRNLERTSE